MKRRPENPGLEQSEPVRGWLNAAHCFVPVNNPNSVGCSIPAQDQCLLMSVREDETIHRGQGLEHAGSESRLPRCPLEETPQLFDD